MTAPVEQMTDYLHQQAGLLEEIGDAVVQAAVRVRSGELIAPSIGPAVAGVLAVMVGEAVLTGRRPEVELLRLVVEALQAHSNVLSPRSTTATAELSWLATEMEQRP